MDTLNLKAYLANIGMTMTDFCQKIDCDRTYLSSVSSGRVMPGRKLARNIFNATGGIIKLQTKTRKSDQNKTSHNECNTGV